MGTEIYQFDLSRVLTVINKSIEHLNRFVREIAYFVINSILISSKGILTKIEGEGDRPADETARAGKAERFLFYCKELVPFVQ